MKARTKTPRHLRIAAVMSATCACVALTGAAPPPGAAGPRAAETVTAARLAAMVRTTTDGLVTHDAVADPAARTLVVRRDRPGLVEVHGRLNDVVIAQAGAATLLVGGRAEGGRETGPDEWRGGTIVGGERRPLRPGDVAWIPAGVPHQMIVGPGGSFTYVVVKTDKAP